MGYRGDDLDLRTPEGASGQAGAGDFAPFQPGDPFFVAARHRPQPAAASRHAPPIWVDATALECCNHAFDVAQAHRAAEVRLEHLIYALTRTEDAADALDQRGIRVPALRRDTATVIATDIPASLGNGKSVPRRADAFEEVLRLAAAAAYRRHAPVSVGDIVNVLFDSGVEFAGLQRLLGPSLRSVADGFDTESVRERMRTIAVPMSSPRTFASEFAGPSAAQLFTQQSRIEALEQSIRSFMSEMANERKILSGVLQDLQRELMAQRDDTSRLGGLTQDKVQTVFGDRLQSLEQAFLSARGPISADVGSLQDRLALVERALLSEITAVRAAVEALAARPAADFATLSHRLEVIEHAVAAERDRALAGEEKLAQSLAALAASIERQPSEIAAVVTTPLVEHLNALTLSRDTQHAAVTDALTETGRRIGSLDEALASHVERAETAAGHAAENLDVLREGLARLGEAIEDQNARLAETLTQDISEVHDGLSRLDTGQQLLTSSLDTQGHEAAGAFAGLAARIESLEQAAATPVAMLEQLSVTVDKMHKVTVEKYYRRNRFWYWLFGTDDWLAASWPSQSARIAEELRAIKR
jgi:hypothetical protein